MERTRDRNYSSSRERLGLEARPYSRSSTGSGSAQDHDDGERRHDAEDAGALALSSVSASGSRGVGGYPFGKFAADRLYIPDAQLCGFPGPSTRPIWAPSRMIPGIYRPIGQCDEQHNDWHKQRQGAGPNDAG